jgi:hypothetical protein
LRYSVSVIAGSIQTYATRKTIYLILEIGTASPAKQSRRRHSEAVPTGPAFCPAR